MRIASALPLFCFTIEFKCSILGDSQAGGGHVVFNENTTAVSRLVCWITSTGHAHEK